MLSRNPYRSDTSIREYEFSLQRYRRSEVERTFTEKNCKISIAKPNSPAFTFF
jgi:hypothetical protein